MNVLLHNIRSIYNVGSIFRTADAVGIKKIYLTGYTPTPTDALGNQKEAFTKTSLGAERSVEWEYMQNISGLLGRLKKQGMRIAAIEQSPRAIPLEQTQFTKKDLARVVLMLGNEVKGISTQLLARADSVIEIPMQGKKESLNISVAFGIAAYWLRLQEK